MLKRFLRPNERSRPLDWVEMQFRGVAAVACGLVAGAIVSSITQSPVICSSAFFLTIPFTWWGMKWLLHGGFNARVRRISKLAGSLAHRVRDHCAGAIKIAEDLPEESEI